VKSFLKAAYASRKIRALAALSAASWLGLTGTASAMERAVVEAAAADAQPVEFNIYLPVRDRAGVDALIEQLHTQGSPLYRQWLTPTEFNQRFGPDSKTVAAITSELRAYGLVVTEVHTHSLHVSGTAGGVKSAFRAPLALGHYASGRSVMIAAAPLRLTPTLAAAGAVIPAFSGVAHMQKHSVVHALGDNVPQNRTSPIGGYWFDDLKQAYAYPSYQKLTGKGVVIGVLMNPGFNPKDMTLYFSHEKIATPTILTFNIEGGAPFDKNESFETHLDIQQTGGMAPQSTIVLFNLPDLADDSILAGITDIDEYNIADVINMSFGEFETAYTAAYPFNNGVDQSGILQVYDDLFAQGNAQGITFVASSGDLGALEAPPPACFDSNPPNPCGKMLAAPSTPATSPHVTGVGGTNLVTTFDSKNPNDLNSAYVRENAYDDPLDSDIFYGTSATGVVWGSGGGISYYFAKPSYQFLVSQSLIPWAAHNKRTSPDVALHMGGCPLGTTYLDVHGVCPPDRSYDIVAIGGSFFGVVGTSASSPDFAGLTALKIEQERSRLGNVNYELYFLAQAQTHGAANKLFHKSTPGSNGKYSTGFGYNLVLGNGTLNGIGYVLGPNLPAAGIPQTPTNP
jgi:subtilase family serine protease